MEPGVFPFPVNVNKNMNYLSLKFLYVAQSTFFLVNPKNLNLSRDMYDSCFICSVPHDSRFVLSLLTSPIPISVCFNFTSVVCLPVSSLSTPGKPLELISVSILNTFAGPCRAVSVCIDCCQTGRCCIHTKGETPLPTSLCFTFLFWAPKQRIFLML